ITVNDEWAQEPDGFAGLKFGATKEDIEKRITFEYYGVDEDVCGPDSDTPYPTLGITHFSFGNANITVSLIFTPADGLHCIRGMFATDRFEDLRAAFVSLYGQPHDHTLKCRQSTKGC